jgi:hypothetical protein
VLLAMRTGPRFHRIALRVVLVRPVARSGCCGVSGLQKILEIWCLAEI